jgi:hypothetical protein
MEQTSKIICFVVQLFIYQLGLSFLFQSSVRNKKTNPRRLGGSRFYSSAFLKGRIVSCIKYEPFFTIIIRLFIDLPVLVTDKPATSPVTYITNHMRVALWHDHVTHIITQGTHKLHRSSDVIIWKTKWRLGTFNHNSLRTENTVVMEHVSQYQGRIQDLF